MRLIAPLLIASLLSACATVVPQQAPPPPARTPETSQVPPSRPPQVANNAGFIAPRVMEGAGLSGVIREGERALAARFGAPRLTVVEGDMRKLQFTGQACVLDVFLYPLTPGGEPVATWVETRRSSDGAAVDRAACVQALSRR
ncbi:hypothetical protein GRI62_13405 [Erythrobacter arachoides]|uniref:Lipoprotein n=1 Tax=Aurantiacibacter arachoides TaxID=1850444 RepID=A0A845A396_9SPHN|nr:hypothetical protein [Aurantiacibacter arachoides]MXO94595.1 hypothetical protein [Aurantiacibacter arachoides]GGD62260.1 hypothetical protein GCM10011411_23100 [Aurantiacibacter arachoides]